MRWDNLTIESAAFARLPGYREAVVRRFDAPEALDTRFYEVYAKSAINRVPAASRMPFRHTINPYRGCTHACHFCLSGETRILMADGRHSSLADLRAGDRIVGTVRRGQHRRFVTTAVRDRWSTLKPAYRIVLEDGTDLIASGDHRFLTGRGWKHVTGAGHGPDRRAHLTCDDELLGTGGFAPLPPEDAEYRCGYLRGAMRGDAQLGAEVHDRPFTDGDERFRLARADLVAAGRVRRYLADAGTGLREKRAQAAGAVHRPVRGVRAAATTRGEQIAASARWPIDPSDAWRKGFLAGIFDAAGSCEGQALRIGKLDDATLRWTEACLRHFGFGCAREARGIRLRGGLREQLRFVHLTDPAARGKLRLEGRPVKTDAGLRVADVIPMGLAMRMYDVTTGTGDFIANGVVSHNCFARPTHTYLGFDAGRDFEKEIVVKVNVPEVLRAELRRPSWRREHIAMGTNTDPYQWCESRYRLMPAIWEALRDFRNPCSVLTKSPLLLRDLELMKQVAAVTDIHANLSIPTLDDKPWRASEPHTPHPRKRIEAVAELNRAGIPTGVLVAPLMPGINDSPEQVEAILQACADAGATSVGGIALHLRGEVRHVFMDWLRSYRPDLVERYEELYARGAYVPHAESERIRRLLRSSERDPAARGGARGIRGMRGGMREAQELDAWAAKPRVVQEALF